MIYKLDNEKGVISPVSMDEARTALLRAGWSNTAIDELPRTRKMLWTDAAHYCAVEFYLKEQRDQMRCGAREGAGK